MHTPSPITTNNATGLRIGVGPGTFTWTGEASLIVVNWTLSKYREVGRPPDFSEKLYTTKVSTTSGERRFMGSTASAAWRSANSTLVALAPEPIQLLATSDQVGLQAARGKSWKIPTLAPELQREIQLPPGLAEASVTFGKFQLRGNFSLFIDDSNLTIRAASTEHFESGTWTEPLAPNPATTQPVRYRYYQTLRIDVADGHVTLAATGSPTTIMAKQYEFDGRLAATFGEPSGTVTVEGRPQELRGQTFETSGNGRLAVWNESATPPRMRAQLDLAATGPGSHDPADGAPNPNAAPGRTLQVGDREGWTMPFLLLAGVPAAAAAIVLLARRMQRPPDITDVEWAVLNKKRRRSKRLAARLVAAEPKNPDAVFLYGAALLLEKRFGAIIARLEPLADGLPKSSRRGVAYVLAVASRKLGDGERERRWAQEAAQDPLLRDRMASDDDWKDVVPKAATPDRSLTAYA